MVIITASFPACVMEVSEDEVKEWLSPKDLGIGNTIDIMGRKFLLYVCIMTTAARASCLMLYVHYKC